MWRSPRFVALIRAFLARFFEPDGATGDLRAVFAWLLAFLAAPGLIVPPFVAFAWSKFNPTDQTQWGWFRVASHLGADALRLASLGDKATYMAFACAATAAVAALVWNRLLPDRRDVLVLGPLPVTASAIVRARLTALLLFALALAVGSHALASLTFGMLLAAGSSAAFAVRGIAAHFAASVLASLFVFSAIVSLQGLVAAAAGPRWFARVSSLLQTALVAATLAALFAVGRIGPAARALFEQGVGWGSWWTHTPPFWFLGLYESVLGTSNPFLQDSARVALAATGAAVACALCVYPLAYRRIAAAALSQLSSPRPRVRDSIRRHALRLLARTSPADGVAQFFVATILRVERHRLILASAAGVAATWTVTSWLALPPPAMWRYPPVRFFAMPLAVQFLMLAGLRAAAAVPSDLAPAWLFEFTAPNRRDARAALERVMGLFVILPVAVCSSPVVWWYCGAHAAVFHAALTMAVGAALAEVVLGAFTEVPCAHAARPDVETARMRWPLYLAGVVAFTTTFAALEALFVTSIVAPGTLGPFAPDLAPWRMGFVAALAALAVLLRKKALSQPTIRDGDEFAILQRAIQEGRENTGRADLAQDSPDSPAPRRSGVFAAPIEDTESWFEGMSTRPAGLLRDLRLGVRRLLRAPAFAFFSILTLAVSIGATTAIYSAVASGLRQPAGFADPDRVVTIGSPGPAGRRGSLSWPDLLDLRASMTTLASIAASSPFPAALTTDAGATRVDGALVTGSYFQTLGVTPLLGRMLAPHDDQPDAPPAIVLSEHAWRLYFGSDPSIAGRAVRVAGTPYLVVGVAPRAFRGVTTQSVPPAFWAPLGHPPLTDFALTSYRDSARRDRSYLQVVGRMKGDTTRTRLDAELAAVAAHIDAAEPLKDRAGRRIPRRWSSARADAGSWSARTVGVSALIVLMPVLVLLVACTNLANLVMARGAERRNEMLVRRALGASRWSLVRTELVEHGLLCLAGGLGGVALAHVLITQGLAFVVRTFGSTPQTQFDIRLDSQALVAALVAAVLAVGVAALIPAIRLTRHPAQGQALGDLTAGVRPGRRLEKHLIAFQVSASLALLLMTAVCVRQLLVVRQSFDLDIELSRVAVATVDFDLRTHDDTRVLDLGARILAEVSRGPGIEAAALGTGVPQIERNSDYGPAITSGSPDLVRVLGLRLLAGRTLLAGDSPSAAVISESEAREAFGGIDVVGRDLVLDSASAPGGKRHLTVVGVVADAGRDAVTHEGLRQVYVPFVLRRDAQVPMPPVWLLARQSEGEAGSAAALLTRAIRTTDPDLPIRFAGSAQALVTAPIATVTLVSELLGCLAGLALALSVTGLYGVTSHLVTNRAREMGIRLALGAEPRSIVRLVMTNAIRPVAYGLAIGVVVALIGRAALRPLFPSRTVGFDGATLVLAVLPLVMAMAVACYVPARRAAAVNPNDALRRM
jgi:predicted permease